MVTLLDILHAVGNSERHAVVTPSGIMVARDMTWSIAIAAIVVIVPPISAYIELYSRFKSLAQTTGTGRKN